MEALYFRARDFRRIARDKLGKRYWLSVAVSLVAGLLGAGGGYAPNFNYNLGANSTNAQSMNEMFSADGLENFFSSSFGIPADIFEEVVTNPYFIGVFTAIFAVAMLFSVATFFIGAPVLLGSAKYYTDLCNNENPTFGVLFSRFKYFWKAVGLRAFMALFIFLWTLLLIVPGIIAGYRYAMAPYLMAQNPDIGIREAVNQSKQLMMGHKGRLFCLNLSFIGWILLAALTFGIGMIFLTPYMEAANAAFYLDRTGQGIPLNPQGAAPQGPGPELI